MEGRVGRRWRGVGGGGVKYAGEKKQIKLYLRGDDTNLIPTYWSNVLPLDYESMNLLFLVVSGKPTLKC